jgi:hypothetical protein
VILILAIASPLGLSVDIPADAGRAGVHLHHALTRDPMSGPGGLDRAAADAVLARFGYARAAPWVLAGDTWLARVTVPPEVYEAALKAQQP